MHVGQGEFEPAPPAVMREVLGTQFEQVKDEPTIPLADALVKGSLQVFSHERAKAPPKVDEQEELSRPIDPERVARWMRPGDWLVLARLDHPDLPAGVFYVLRRDGERFKVVLGE